MRVSLSLADLDVQVNASGRRSSKIRLAAVANCRFIYLYSNDAPLVQATSEEACGLPNQAQSMPVEKPDDMRSIKGKRGCSTRSSSSLERRDRLSEVDC